MLRDIYVYLENGLEGMVQVGLFFYQTLTDTRERLSNVPCNLLKLQQK